MSEGEKYLAPTDPSEQRESPAFPFANAEQPLTLKRLFAGGGYFTDGRGRAWKFDAEKRQWSPLEVMDFYPMATQFQMVTSPDRSTFSSIEEATLYVMEHTYRDDLKLYDRAAADEQLSEATRALNREVGEEIREIIQQIREYFASSDIAEKQRLYGEIERRIITLHHE